MEEPFELGEVSFHYGFTYHRARANTTENPRKVLVWPVAVVLFLVTVVVVNLAFIWVAVDGQDEVAPSYVTGER